MKKIYLLLLLACVGGVANAQMVHFYKYGQKVRSVATVILDSIATLNAEEHPVTPYIEAELQSLAPNTESNSWTAGIKAYKAYSTMATLDRDIGYAFTESPIPCDDVEFMVLEPWNEYPDISYRNYGHDIELTFSDLASDSTYHLKLRILKDGVPFFASLDIATGHSLYDVLKETNCIGRVEVGGHTVGLPSGVLGDFLSKYQDVLGSDGPSYVLPALSDLVCTYLASLSYDQLPVTSTVDYTGGTLALLGSVPDGAIDYIKQTLHYDQPIVLPMMGYEMPLDSWMQPTMTDTLIVCAPEWNAPWEKYLEVHARSLMEQSEVSYETSILLPSMKYDLYVTMVSDSLPTWFQVGQVKRASLGNYSSSRTYYHNPNPVTEDSGVENADIILRQSNSQRCFPTGRNTCERILIQQGISSEYLTPMKFSIRSWGPSSGSYRERIYTRVLRIAGIELVPSAEAAE